MMSSMNNREVSLMNRKNSGNEEIEIVKEIKANRKYKDTVFRMLFQIKRGCLNYTTLYRESITMM